MITAQELQQYFGQNQHLSNQHLANEDLVNPLTGASYSSNYQALLEERKKLPIWPYKQQFMDMLDRQNTQFILLEAETGSGKTTQIPQWCVEWIRKRQPHSHQMVVCTQPRRLATSNIAKRVAKEMDVQLGKEVGYSIRFENDVCFQTVLKYCTDGVLFSEATCNNNLGQYGVIVLDEVHERTLTTDVLMGLVKAIAAVRPELRVVVMSASMDTGEFRRYFSERCGEMKIPGRTHPVEIIYSPCWGIRFGKYQADVYSMAVDKVAEVHQREKEGDILLFMTGEEDIEHVCERLREREFGPGLDVLPLYSALPPEQQQKIFEPRQIKNDRMTIDRRCIVATNIAESSMTIEGVVFVIDLGYCKRKEFDPQSRIESLLIRPITKASAIQRAGRAGRTRPGKCFRLYHKWDFLGMKMIEPEIRHSNLTNVLLRMKKSEVPDMNHFDFMDAPPAELLSQSISMLTHLEALDVSGCLTPLGMKMAEIPVDPPFARMLIESVRLECTKEVIIIVAMLSSPSYCFNRPKNRQEQAEVDQAKASFQHDKGDHLTLLRVYNNFIKCPNDVNMRQEWCNQNFLNYNSLQYAADVCWQLEDVMRRRLNIEFVYSNLPNDPIPDIMVFNIIKALIAGSFMKVAFFKQTGLEGHYITVESLMPAEQLPTTSAASRLTTMPQSQKVPKYRIHPNSVLFGSKVYRMRPEWILYESAIQLKGGKHYLRTVSSIRPECLMEMAPKYYTHARTMCPELHRGFRQFL